MMKTKCSRVKFFSFSYLLVLPLRSLTRIESDRGIYFLLGKRGNPQLDLDTYSCSVDTTVILPAALGCEPEVVDFPQMLKRSKSEGK